MLLYPIELMPQHQVHQDRIAKDKRYDARAKELGYEVRHVWGWDFFESGVEKWHSLVEPT